MVKIFLTGNRIFHVLGVDMADLVLQLKVQR